MCVLARLMSFVLFLSFCHLSKRCNILEAITHKICIKLATSIICNRNNCVWRKRIYTFAVSYSFSDSFNFSNRSTCNSMFTPNFSIIVWCRPLSKMKVPKKYVTIFSLIVPTKICALHILTENWLLSAVLCELIKSIHDE